MNKLSQVFFILLLAFAASCSKSDDDNHEPLRDYSEQYAKDLDTIDEFIDTHYMTVTPDFDVTFTEITDDTPGTSIRLQTEYPLEYKMVPDDNSGIDYKVYYIKLREGVNNRPVVGDSIHVTYKGNLINLVQFGISTTPSWFTLDRGSQLTSTITGWWQIFPLFKTGNYDTGGGPNPVTFTDYGAGVMFLPSALAYYSENRTSIPSYSPLIFSFKLYELEHRDQDRDGFLSKDEVANPGDDPLEYDTDADGTPNFLDVDDDGDHILTKNELHRDSSGNIIFEDCDGDGIPNYLDIDSNGAICN